MCQKVQDLTQGNKQRNTLQAGSNLSRPCRVMLGESEENMNRESIRKKRFLCELDNLLIDTVDDCIDEDGNKTETHYTEEMIYNIIMETDEYHLLGTNYVREIIHKFVQDFGYRMQTLRQYNLI